MEVDGFLLIDSIDIKIVSYSLVLGSVRSVSALLSFTLILWLSVHTNLVYLAFGIFFVRLDPSMFICIFL